MEGREEVQQEQNENQRGREGKRNGSLLGAANTGENLAKWRMLHKKSFNTLVLLNSLE